MVEYKKCKLEHIIEDAKGNKQKVAFLKELAKRTETNKKGETCPISFISLKRAYFEEYYKELLPVAKKKVGMLDLINSL